MRLVHFKAALALPVSMVTVASALRPLQALITAIWPSLASSWDRDPNAV